MNCSYCLDAGYTCEIHPWSSWPHDDCPGPGVLCPVCGDKPLPNRPILPVEHAWSLIKGGRRVDCQLRFHGESYGWEMVLAENGVLTFGMRFLTRDGAARAAELERRHLLGNGWATLGNA